MSAFGFDLYATVKGMTMNHFNDKEVCLMCMCVYVYVYMGKILIISTPTCLYLWKTNQCHLCPLRRQTRRMDRHDFDIYKNIKGLGFWAFGGPYQNSCVLRLLHNVKKLKWHLTDKITKMNLKILNYEKPYKRPDLTWSHYGWNTKTMRGGKGDFCRS